MENLRIELSKNLKPKPQDETKLGFGNIFTDHMFLMDYDEGQGWHNARIVPYGPLPLDPAAMALHYSQEVFEGMKAYRAEDGRILLFRPQENFARLNRSNERLCIPQIDEEFALKALIELLKIEKDVIPHIKDTSLYIRPFIIATDAHLGVRTANRYLFVIILSQMCIRDSCSSGNGRGRECGGHDRHHRLQRILGFCFPKRQGGQGAPLRL